MEGLRSAARPQDLHDRFVLTDAKILLVGHGLNDIGAKESFMIVPAVGPHPRRPPRHRLGERVALRNRRTAEQLGSGNLGPNGSLLRRQPVAT